MFWCARKLHPFWRFENCVPRNHARYAKWTYLWDFKLPGSTESGHAAGYSDKCEDVEDAGDRVARTEGWLMKICDGFGWGFQLDQGADPQMARCVSVWGGYRSHWISWGLLVGAHSTQKHIMMCFRVGVPNAQTMQLLVLKQTIWDGWDFVTLFSQRSWDMFDVKNVQDKRSRCLWLCICYGDCFALH